MGKITVMMSFNEEPSSCVSMTLVIIHKMMGELLLRG